MAEDRQLMAQCEDLCGEFKTRARCRAQGGDDGDDVGERGVREAYPSSARKCNSVIDFGVFSRDR